MKRHLRFGQLLQWVLFWYFLQHFFLKHDDVMLHEGTQKAGASEGC